MTKQHSRRFDFKDFAADLEHIFDSLESEEELVIEKGGKTFRLQRLSNDNVSADAQSSSR